MPIVVSLSGWTGTRSKRNFHRPQSNCGMALNSGCRAFIVFRSQLRLRIQSPRQSTGSVPQTRKKCSNLSFQESDFFSCHFLKRSKIDISAIRNFLGRSSAAVSTRIAERAPWNAARLEGQALFPAGSDFPERVKVFLHESLRALIRPIQADT